MHETMHGQAPTRIYVNRVKAFLFGVVGGGIYVLMFVLIYVLPKPEVVTQPWTYEEPFKTLLFGAGLLLFGAVVLMGLYWTFTPSPMLELNSIGMLYQRYPLLRRVVRWEDVASIRAYTTSWKSYFRRVTLLTLRIRLKPHSVLSYRGREEFEWKIGQTLLPVSFDEVVRDIQRYHHVNVSTAKLPHHEHQSSS